MKRSVLLLLLVAVSYLFGIFSGHLEIFPFQQLKLIKRILVPGGAEERERIANVNELEPVSQSDLDNPLVYVTYGQSNSSNYGQLGYQTTGAVYMFLNGVTYKFREPALGGAGINSSVWGRVGDLLSQKHKNRPIVFVNAGWAGATIRELTRDDLYDFFEMQFRSALNTFGKIDGILFHQGESDHQRFDRKYDYGEEFLVFYKKVMYIHPAKVYLSQASICNSSVDAALLSIQNKLISENEGILRGPNTDLLKERKFRLPDNCHFSSEGLDALAVMWVNSINEQSEN